MNSFPAALLAAALLLPGGAVAQTWNYVGYHSITGEAWRGSLELTEPAPGRFVARLVLHNPENCYGSKLAAQFERGQDQQVITVVPRMGGCPELRFVLKADGTGGRREIRQPDGTWAWDGAERGLTRR